MTDACGKCPASLLCLMRVGDVAIRPRSRDLNQCPWCLGMYWTPSGVCDTGGVDTYPRVTCVPRASVDYAEWRTEFYEAAQHNLLCLTKIAPFTRWTPGTISVFNSNDTCVDPVGYVRGYTVYGCHPCALKFTHPDFTLSDLKRFIDGADPTKKTDKEDT